MKIALVTPYDYPYPGGVTEHIRHLDREFRARGHETRILAASSQAEENLDPHTVKVIGTFHAYGETNSVYEYARPLAEYLYRQLDGRVFVSEAVRDVITHYFPGESRIIPNGIDFTRFASPQLRPIEAYHDGRPNLLFVGRMDERNHPPNHPPGVMRVHPAVC